ncbi:SDR family NAD(P)-dependent oxidoreductase [Shewanella aestuarii]|uniref:SDR family NAD(P)-dependent oxidoreductase n=1 Tax=Shewanella aestuarii TaxID=1028752 RepID=A0A6G9QML3_9GAMM|nr:SDR family NAD(P)-dependent oxidoreductase [Shewanella aestuarii]QIR15333.1 SDR family NAD(P)-dependent oxidoreductase [Shewanella aestuarii]
MATITQAVLITGATSGIGLATAKYYLTQGYHVIACGRNQQALDELSGCYGLVFDVTKVDEIKQASVTLQQYLQRHQLPLTQVILNAGSCEYIDDVIQFDADLFARVINTNLISIGYCIEAFLPLMAANSQLGLMSSSATYLPFPRAQAYGASKAGLSYLGRSLRVDLASNSARTSGIGVSVICPGFVKTPLTDKNDFAMPMRITSEQAAIRIFNGMASRKFEIHFPRRFTWLLKLVSLLPEKWLVSMLKNSNK